MRRYLGPVPPAARLEAATVAALIDDLDQLPFDHQFTAALPGDPDRTNRPRPVLGAAYSRVDPTPVANPVTLAWSPEVADLLGLDPAL